MTDAAAPPAPPAPPPTEQQRQQAALDAVARSRSADAANAQPPPANVAPPPAAAKTKPDGVPEKFWNAQTGEVNYKAWGEAHSSLETKFHGQQPPAQQQQTPPANQPPANQPPADERAAAVQAATEEFAKDGKLSDATYEKLAKNGYDRTMVDGYIAGQQAQQAPARQALFDGAGGTEAEYRAMIAWAGVEGNLPAVEVEAYNAQLTSKNPEVLKAASTALYAKYKAGATVEGQRTGGAAPAGNSGRFNSKEEMKAAMTAPSPTQPGKSRYETDHAYRNEVIQKIAASRAANIDIYS